MDKPFKMKNMAYWKAKNENSKPPTKWVAQAVGMVIGANKKRQANKDAADKAKGDAIQNAYSGGLS